MSCTDVADPAPFPTEGDPDQDTTFSAVGYALSCWEGLEVELCGLLAALKDWRRASTEAIEAYSQPRIFAERLAILREAFEVWAIEAVDQKQEGEIKAILCRASDLSAVRNNIAHGVISTFDRKPKPLGVLVEPGPDQMFTWCWSPPFYNKRGQVFVGRDYLQFKPRWAYVAPQMRDYGDRFDALRNRAWRVALSIGGPAWT